MGAEMDCAWCHSIPCECKPGEGRNSDRADEARDKREMTLTMEGVFRAIAKTLKQNFGVVSPTLMTASFQDSLRKNLILNEKAKRHTVPKPTVPTVMGKLHEMVEIFNKEIIDLPIPDVPTPLSGLRKKFGLQHLIEELDEFDKAKDLEGQADALLDLIYVAHGRLFEMGISGPALFEEVHEANMRKRKGSLKKRPGSKGHDAVKPDGWKPPNLTPLLLATKDDVARASAMRTREREGAKPEPKRLVPREVRKPKILVVGHGRHGKDTASEILAGFMNLSFTSSSAYCAERVIWPILQGQKYEPGSEADQMFMKYSSPQECFEDRANHRKFWYEAIQGFNAEDRTALGRAILADHDIYCGLRHRSEFHALKQEGVFDYCIWIDRSDVLAPESPDSMSLEPWMADFVVDNNSSLSNLHVGLARVRDLIDKDMGL